MAQFEFATTGQHTFVGRTDRWCEVCNLPDRHPIHKMEIDWYKEMRSCVGDAAELADRVSCTDSDVGGALARLCNVVTHLLDKNEALAQRVTELETINRVED
jgi:hypothetical protein